MHTRNVTFPVCACLARLLAHCTHSLGARREIVMVIESFSGREGPSVGLDAEKE